MSDPLLVLSVMASAGTEFASYDLLQTIYAAGFQFGEMNLFHYYSPEKENEEKSILFSLASASEPGEFNLDKMGNFTCPGLILFLDLNRVKNPEQAFERMLETAQQLTDDLDAELRATPRTPLTDAIFRQYRDKIFARQKNVLVEV